MRHAMQAFLSFTIVALAALLFACVDDAGRSEDTSQADDAMVVDGACIGCGQDTAPVPYCGDAVCNGGENCRTCADDCGQCPATCGDGVCDSTESPSICGIDCPCFDHLQCAADQVCVEGLCNLAWGRLYRFTVLSGAIAGSNPLSGGAWDPLGGAPDPYVVADIDDAAIGRTSTVQDTFEPSWTEYFDIVLGDGEESVLRFTMWDEDVDETDYIVGVEGTSDQWLTSLREHGGSAIIQQGSSLTIVIAPL